MIPVVRREHLQQLEKIQEVFPSRRHEAHFRRGVSRLIKPKLWNFQRVLHTLDATQEFPRNTRLHSRGSTRVPPTSRGAPIPPFSSRGLILSLRGRERIRSIPVKSQEEALSRGKARGLQGRATIPRVPQMYQSIPGKTVLPVTLRVVRTSRSLRHSHLHTHCGMAWTTPTRNYPTRTVTAGLSTTVGS